ncbi:TolB-like translocation protein [Frankia sp. AiPs1]|uniref:TolB family protein n=1 Tax=Frankia sp. AiPa1 TaxID=573492 RepID=UPI00202ADE3B|nr:TolB-like translocation protein [Frankia sp. AiPa1]MCL9759736.1 TolB-like translocation protein [Frankia sp. AiPa1]
MRNRARLLVLFLTVLVLGAVSIGWVRYAAAREARKDRQQDGGPPMTSGQVTLAAGASRRLVFRSMLWGPHRDELASVPANDAAGPRTASKVSCLRFYAAAGTGVCLRRLPGTLAEKYQAVVLDVNLHERRHFTVNGIPTRARVSPSGRMVAWTVFVSGDSYGGTQFSTRTSILDTSTWTLVRSLEDYQVIMNGKVHHSVDDNFWGVTFADDDHFYATLGTHAKTYLVRGDVRARTVTTLRENVECPSLSPDGTRLAFKKRVAGASPDAPWREYVLDLRTLRETPLGEHRSVDDQAVWLDDDTLVYALAGDYGADLWTIPADGSGSPARLMTAALAPAVIG